MMGGTWTSVVAPRWRVGWRALQWATFSIHMEKPSMTPSLCFSVDIIDEGAVSNTTPSFHIEAHTGVLHFQ